MSGRAPKVTPETWVQTARHALVEEGLAGVKVDRLATRLRVTRGGFYHNFRDRDDLLARLLDDWVESCRFLPPEEAWLSAASAMAWIEAASERLIEENGYDSAFDMAVREWGRSDQRAAWAVERSDRERISTLQRCFVALGYANDKALIRARVFYFHQIGYYSIGIRSSLAERKRNAKLYLEILCGSEASSRVRMTESE